MKGSVIEGNVCTASPDGATIPQQFSRTQMLIGTANIQRLRAARVAIFGIGGVGGYVCEALVRSGVGEFDLVDSDKVDITNLNRQIIATHSTVGRYKTDVMKERMLDINPDAKVQVYRTFFLPENADSFSFDMYDYVVDAIDTVTAKIELILRAKAAGVPVISAMGAGNKLDAGKFKVADIYQTTVCPLARVMRRELKKRNVDSLKVVYSEEPPITPAQETEGSEELQSEERKRRSTPGSIVYAPAIAGLMIAGEVLKDLVK